MPICLSVSLYKYVLLWNFGDEKNEWPRRPDKSRMLKRNCGELCEIMLKAVPGTNLYLAMRVDYWAMPIL